MTGEPEELSDDLKALRTTALIALRELQHREHIVRFYRRARMIQLVSLLCPALAGAVLLVFGSPSIGFRLLAAALGIIVTAASYWMFVAGRDPYYDPPDLERLLKWIVQQSEAIEDAGLAAIVEEFRRSAFLASAGPSGGPRS